MLEKREIRSYTREFRRRNLKTVKKALTEPEFFEPYQN